MAVLGFDLSPLRSALSDLGQGIRSGVQSATQGDQGGDYLGYLAGLTPPSSSPAWQALGQVAQRVAPAVTSGPAQDYLGQLAQYAQQQAGASPAMDFLSSLSAYGLPASTTGAVNQNWADLGAYAYAQAHPPTGIGKGAAAVAATATNAAGRAGAGLPSDVAKWADQTNATFGDLGGWVPSAMLAIIQHESNGSPTAYNQAGDAWGLFQQLHLGTDDPNAQFTAARQLLQEKLGDINASYARNGLSPDDRTRARDLFLAWAGHFDYSSAQPNTASRDVGSGQDYQSFLDQIMPMYDNIVQGRQQAAPPGGGSAGLAGVTPGTGGQIMQEFGVTPTSEGYKAAGNDVYGYGSAYGMAGGGHPGVDWAVPRGTQVATPLSGTVSVVGNDHGSGYFYQDTNNPDPDHSGEFQITLANGDILILGHLSHINAQVGQQVNAGTLIGASGGSDGDHVHVEYRQRQADGSYRVIDPRSVLGG